MVVENVRVNIMQIRAIDNDILAQRMRMANTHRLQSKYFDGLPYSYLTATNVCTPCLVRL